MRTRNRNIICIFLIASWFNTSAIVVPEAVEENKGKILFKIERSRDSDEIWYTLNLNQNGSLNQDMPVKAFWVRKTENKEIEVERIFVEFDGGSFLAPSISEVKLTGIDLKKGGEISEIIGSSK